MRRTVRWTAEAAVVAGLAGPMVGPAWAVPTIVLVSRTGRV